MSSFDLIAPRLPALVACFLGALFCLRLGGALPFGRERRSFSGFGTRQESGTATLDFVLTFPLFMMIVLIVIQFALMVNARIIVSYAAYAATRSAVVWMEDGLEDAERRAEAAAEIACLPISPAVYKLPDPGLVPLLLHSSETPVLPGSELTRRSRRLGGKFLYSSWATEVEIAGTQEDEEFGPRDPVTVTVTHHFRLTVPYADGIFAQPWSGSLFGWDAVPIQDSYTLLNEGKVRTTGKGGKRCTPFSASGILSLLRRLFS